MKMKSTFDPSVLPGSRRRRRRRTLVTLLLALLAGMLCCAMLYWGNTVYPVKDLVRALAGEQLQGVSFAVNTIRLPRMLAGLFAGFAFGLAGHVFQTLLRNPLANPNILGITSGSSAAAVFCILILHASGAMVSVASVLAGLAAAALIYVFAVRKSFSIGRLILVGIGIQAMLDALISYLLLVGAQQDIPAAIRWLSGSLNGSQMHGLWPLVISVIAISPAMIALGRHLQLLELGEQPAVSLGVNASAARIALIFASVCMVAIATSTTGPIAFVSFLAGPIARRLVGAGSPGMIPAGLVGVNLVLAADLIGQFAFTVRFPAGIITGILGAPYLLYLLVRMNRAGEL